MVSRTPRLRLCHLWRSTESRADVARTRTDGKTAIRQFDSVRSDLRRTRRNGESVGLAGQSLRESGKRLLVAKGGSDLRQSAQRAAFPGAGRGDFSRNTVKIDNGTGGSRETSTGKRVKARAWAAESIRREKQRNLRSAKTEIFEDRDEAEPTRCESLSGVSRRLAVTLIVTRARD